MSLSIPELSPNMSFLDPSLLNKIAPGVEAAINIALTMDPAAQKHLKRLKGCTLKIDLGASNKAFYFGVSELPCKTPADGAKAEASQDKLSYHVVLIDAPENISVQVKASILSLIKLAGLKDKSPLFKTKEIELSGDSVRIQQIQGFLTALNIDWEGMLASFIGDVPAHILGQTFRHSFSWSRNLTLALIRDAEEFIKYELRIFPNKAVADKQFTAIDKLYQATESLEKRIRARLQEARSKS